MNYLSKLLLFILFHSMVFSENEINLKTSNPEFIEWKWIFPNELPEVIVDFKKDMYTDLLNKLRKFID